MHVGILGGTGPAGRGLAARLGVAGAMVTIGSRDPERAKSTAEALSERWPDRRLVVTGSDNAGAAAAEIVVVATPWDSASVTARSFAGELEGKVVICMANALLKEGKEMLALFAPRGSVAASVAAAAPGALVVASFHHLPAKEMEDLDGPLRADVLVCSDHPTATAATMSLIDSIEGLRGLDAGSLNQAGAIEAFTAVCITLNIKYRVHSTLGLVGI